MTFDPVAAAESSADLTLALLFNPERASRLVQYHARDPQSPSLDEVIDATFKATEQRPQGIGLDRVIARAVELRAVEALLSLAANPGTSSEARNIARAYLAVLMKSNAVDSPEEQALHDAISTRVTEFSRDPAKFVSAKPIEAPPGMPIGSNDEM